MSDQRTLSQHHFYNNRFRTSSSDGDQPTTTAANIPHLSSLPENVDDLGQPVQVDQPPAQTSGQRKQSGQHSQAQQRASVSQEAPHGSSQVPAMSRQTSTASVPGPAGGGASHNNSNEDVPVPTAPGKPRRLSRQISANTKRQVFAGAKTVSGGGESITTSVDSTGEVFLDLGDPKAEASHHEVYDSSLFAGKRRSIKVSVASSTASIIPNPYNTLNHRLHSVVWCCSCLYFVFFCCLPAIHFMEKSDVEFRQDNQKKASRFGRVATLLFFVGLLLALLFFALIFFLAVYFTTR